MYIFRVLVIIIRALFSPYDEEDHKEDARSDGGRLDPVALAREAGAQHRDDKEDRARRDAREELVAGCGGQCGTRRSQAASAWAMRSSLLVGSDDALLSVAEGLAVLGAAAMISLL